MTLLQTLRSLWDPLKPLLNEATTQKQVQENLSINQLRFKLYQYLETFYAGDYRSLFKGQGLDLKNLREYQPGDEIRKIDWNVFARTGTLHIKEHFEEKQLPIWFFVDATLSMGFGQRISKYDYARQLVSMLGLLALESGHRIGLILWQGRQQPVMIEPTASQAHLQWLMTALEKPLDFQAPTDFPNLSPMLANRALILMLSDFAFLRDLPQTFEILSRLSGKHQIHNVMLIDPVEARLAPGQSWLPISDLRQQETLWLNLHDKTLCSSYEKAFRNILETLQKSLKTWGPVQTVLTENPPETAVLQLVQAA